MDDKGFVATEGKCIISTDVIASIAKTATLEVAGVAGMASRNNELRAWVGSGASRSVRVISNESETVLDIFVNFDEGVLIPDVSFEIQRNVKSAVQSMTGKPVTRVNVFIEDIIFSKDELFESKEN